MRLGILWTFRGNWQESAVVALLQLGKLDLVASKFLPKSQQNNRNIGVIDSPCNRCEQILFHGLDKPCSNRNSTPQYAFWYVLFSPAAAIPDVRLNTRVVLRCSIPPAVTMSSVVMLFTKVYYVVSNVLQILTARMCLCGAKGKQCFLFSLLTDETCKQKFSIEAVPVNNFKWLRRRLEMSGYRVLLVH